MPKQLPLAQNIHISGQKAPPWPSFISLFPAMHYNIHVHHRLLDERHAQALTGTACAQNLVDARRATTDKGPSILTASPQSLSIQASYQIVLYQEALLFPGAIKYSPSPHGFSLVHYTAPKRFLFCF